MFPNYIKVKLDETQFHAEGKHGHSLP